jgi:hypothetical protein
MIHDFTDQSKWLIVPNIPVLDEHELTDDKGSSTGYVDSRILQEIANNNNRRIHETGDPAPLIVGHTSDNPQAPERPVVGYAINYRVRPFRNGRSAIFVDYAVRRKYANVVEDFPRRSVELWLNKRELDPIALLGGTTPERDLGVLIRHARLDRFVLDHRPTTDRQRWLAGVGASRPDDVLLYHARGGTIYRYSLEEPDMAGNCPTGMPAPQRYAEGDDEFEDDGAGDEGNGPPEDFGGGEEGDDGGEDPVVAKVLQSKPIRDLMSKVDEIFDAITGGGEEGGMGAGPGGPSPPEAGMDDGMGGGPPPDEEAAMFHGSPPVRFESTGMPGPGSVGVPQFGKKFSRTPDPAHRGKGATRNGSGSMNGVYGPQRQQRRPAAATADPDKVRMSRQIDGLVRKLARSEAEKTVNDLKGEGIIFADEKAEIDFLSVLDEQSRKYHVENVIKKNYQRRQADPANPAYPGVARYARPDAGQGGEADFDPKDAQEASLFADLVTRRGMKREDAVKFMRSRGQQQVRVG